MSNIFQYSFIKNAFLVGMLISIIVPLIGTVVINRKTSTIGDALSHTSLAGIFLGVILGINPLISGVIISVIAAFLIEFLREKFPKNGDMATAIVMSLGVGLSSLLSDFVTGAQNFESFLFGSIVAITRSDILIISILSIISIVLYFYLYYALVFISVDKTGARLSGVNIRLSEYLFTFLLAIVIAISARIVGVLIVSSLMILPVATAMLVSNNYKQTVIRSVIFGLIFFSMGLMLAIYLNLKPGGSIVMVSVIGLFLVLIMKQLKLNKWA